MTVPNPRSKIRTLFDRFVTELELTVAVALAYVGAMVIVAYGVKTVQDSLYEHPLLAASLLFLPHGIRVLAAFLVGARSIMPLAVGTWIGVGLGLDGNTDPSVMMIPGIFCAFLAFKIFELSGVKIKPGLASLRQWRGIVLVSFVAALINGLSIVMILILSGLDEVKCCRAYLVMWLATRLAPLYCYGA